MHVLCMWNVCTVHTYVRTIVCSMCVSVWCIRTCTYVGVECTYVCTSMYVLVHHTHMCVGTVLRNIAVVRFQVYRGITKRPSPSTASLVMRTT